NYLGSVEDKHYLGDGDIKENHMIHFIHKPLGFNIDLKVVKLTVPHPLTNESVEVDFSNSPTDIIKIQQNLNRNIKKMNNLTQGGSLGESSFSMPKLASDSIGSVLVSE
ncbi:peptidase, partial [Staphylococcus gallinarum]